MDLTPEAKRAFTIQSYTPAPAIDGVELIALARHVDDGGSITELVRLDEGRVQGVAGFVARQVNYSEVAPGAVKAFHVHARQTDVWFVPPSDRMLAVLLDVRRGSRTGGARLRLVLGDGASRLLRIPPGVAHGMKNLGTAPARILYFTDLHFSAEPAACDEGRLPWDFAGPEVWDVARG